MIIGTDKMVYVNTGEKIGRLIAKKQIAYGDSFGQSHKVTEVLYPNGVSKSQMKDFLSVIRIIDKLFRIAKKKGAFGEDPWKDIAGYALLACCKNNHKKF